MGGISRRCTWVGEAQASAPPQERFKSRGMFCRHPSSTPSSVVLGTVTLCMQGADTRTSDPRRATHSSGKCAGKGLGKAKRGRHSTPHERKHARGFLDSLSCVQTFTMQTHREGRKREQ